jgi:hypothetical protein
MAHRRKQAPFRHTMRHGIFPARFAPGQGPSGIGARIRPTSISASQSQRQLTTSTAALPARPQCRR